MRSKRSQKIVWNLEQVPRILGKDRNPSQNYLLLVQNVESVHEMLPIIYVHTVRMHPSLNVSVVSVRTYKCHFV